jgi:hypothetical protein
MPNVPTQGEIFAKLTHHLREAQDCSAQLSHIAGLQSSHPKDQAIAHGWLIVSEQLKRFINTTIMIGMRKR